MPHLTEPEPPHAPAVPVTSPVSAYGGPDAPAPIGGVAAASPADLAELHAAPATGEPPAAATAVDPNGQWWSPANALVLGMVALMLQLVAFYAHDQLPTRESAGLPLDRFDTIVSSLPVIGSGLGPILAVLVAAGALAILLVGIRRGVRETVLQGATGALAGLAVLGSALLPVLLG